jgi:microcystin degradation protein MlrC
MKILIGQIMHETNTFANVPTTVESFRQWGWDVGQEMVNQNRGVRNFAGGMIERAAQLEVEVVPVFSTFAYPAGTITQDTYIALKTELIEGIKAVEAFDAACLALHGAGVAEGIEDLEGELLLAVREVVGTELPVVVTLDLHANVTQTMVEQADAILGNHLYPHTDSFEIGQEAFELAYRIARKEIKPTMHLELLPLMIPTSTTSQSPAREVNHLCWQWEKERDVQDCTFYHGFPYTDIAHQGVAVLTTTNGDPDLAAKVAKQVGSFVWEQRRSFFPRQPSPEEGLKKALELPGSPVVINETSDNPGGGSPGDGTFLLQAMIEANIERSCFGFIYDPQVVRQAHQAGAGRTINVRLGGKTDALHGSPLELNAYVKCLTDGRFVQSSPMGRGAKIDLGLSARLQVGHVDIVVCSVKAQVLDEQIFLLHGIQLADYKVVGLKSSQHFRAGFEPICSDIITVDSPGLTTIDFTVFAYTRLTRAIYPLHPDDQVHYPSNNTDEGEEMTK